MKIEKGTICQHKIRPFMNGVRVLIECSNEATHIFHKIPMCKKCKERARKSYKAGLKKSRGGKGKVKSNESED